MRLSELLHSHVIDADGTDLGPVEDVRLVQDGPMTYPFGAAFRVDGLVAGRASIGTRLGYYRGDVKGPWLLRRIFESMQRRTRYVPWDAVEAWDNEVVRIRLRITDLEAPPRPE